LEVNTRAWKWHTISNQRGFSFIGAWIDYLNKIPIKENSSQQVAWEERLTDYSVLLKECLHGRMRLTPVIKTLRQKKEYAVWSWKDPLPAIMYILTSPVLYVKRY
jgi:predicted ATP-grasp superfamily ATP-dependent carboligase